MASQGPRWPFLVEGHAHSSSWFAPSGDFCDGLKIAFSLSEVEEFVLKAGMGGWVEKLRENHIAYVFPLLPLCLFFSQIGGDRRRIQGGGENGLRANGKIWRSESAGHMDFAQVMGVTGWGVGEGRYHPLFSVCGYVSSAALNQSLAAEGSEPTL